jgi:hypothetical protein
MRLAGVGTVKVPGIESAEGFLDPGISHLNTTQ